MLVVTTFKTALLKTYPVYCYIRFVFQCNEEIVNAGFKRRNREHLLASNPLILAR